MKSRILPNNKFDQIGNVGINEAVKYLNHFRIPRDFLSRISVIEMLYVARTSWNVPLIIDLNGESVALASFSSSTIIYIKSK